jgi:hypothetical protein
VRSFFHARGCDRLVTGSWMSGRPTSPPVGEAARGLAIELARSSSSLTARACTSRRAWAAAAAVARVSSSLGTRRARGAVLGDSTGSPPPSSGTRSSDACFRSPLQPLRPAPSAHRAHSAPPPFGGACSCAASGRPPPWLRRRLRRSSGEGRVKAMGAGER